MKILHLARQFYPAIGGIESVIWHLSHHLQVLEHQVSIVTLHRLFEDKQKKLLLEEIIDGLMIKRIPYIGPQRYAIAPTALRYLKNCDVVHLHSSDFFLDYVALTKWKHKKPLILSTHGLYFHTNFAYKLKQLYFQTLTRLALSQVSAVVCDSQHDLQLLTPIVSPKKLHLIPNGIEYDKLSVFEIDNRDPDLLISVGRLANNKRIDRLLRTFAVVVSEHPATQLVLIGSDWGGLSSLKALSKSLGIEKNVRFVGQVSDSDLLTYLGRASVWLSASEYESFGVALLEAMAAGCVPVVQSLTAFTQLIEDGKEGFFTDFDDSQKSAMKILQVINLPEKQREKIARNARATSARFSWSIIAKKFEELYTQAVDRTL